MTTTEAADTTTAAAPVAAGEVGVEEVIDLLRRAIAGDARIVVERKWRDVWHTDGNFLIDGWRLSGFKRSYGIKYVSEAIAPDGRHGTYDGWSVREGNPVHLLSNDEQDALDEIMESLVPTGDVDAALAILNRAPDVPPEPGDEIRS